MLYRYKSMLLEVISPAQVPCFILYILFAGSGLCSSRSYSQLRWHVSYCISCLQVQVYAPRGHIPSSGAMFHIVYLVCRFRSMLLEVIFPAQVPCFILYILFAGSGLCSSRSYPQLRCHVSYCISCLQVQVYAPRGHIPSSGAMFHIVYLVCRFRSMLLEVIYPAQVPCFILYILFAGSGLCS